MTGSVLHVPRAVKSAVRRRGGRRLVLAATPVIALAVAALPAASAVAAPATPGGLAAAAPAAPAGRDAVPPPPPGWKTLFEDGFNGPAASKVGAKWIYDTVAYVAAYVTRR